MSEGVALKQSPVLAQCRVHPGIMVSVERGDGGDLGNR